MRSMLVGNTKGFSVHARVLIHVDGLLRLFGINVTLFGFSILTAFEMEFCLVHKNLSDTVRVVLPSDL